MADSADQQRGTTSGVFGAVVSPGHRPLHVVFLSYSRRDAGLVIKVSAIIRAVGVTPWRDEEAITPGTRWRVSITRSIEECERMIVFWCRHSCDSVEVRREYLRAIDVEKPIVPVLMDTTELTDPLAAYQFVDVRQLTWWSHEIARWERPLLLIGSLLALIGVAFAYL